MIHKIYFNSDMTGVPTYCIETGPLLWRANQWTGFNIIGTSVMKELELCFIKALVYLNNFGLYKVYELRKTLQ